MPSDLATPKKTNSFNKGLVMDGVIHSSKKRTSLALDVKPKVLAHGSKTTKPITSKSVHRTTSRAQTLHRQAVIKPELIPKIHNRSKTHPDIILTQKNINFFTKKPSIERETRASQTKKSILIQRFTVSNNKNSVVKKSPVHGEVVSAKPLKPIISNTKTTPVILPSTVTNATHGNIDELVDQALNSATAHKQKSPKRLHIIRRMPKLVSVGTALLIVVILGGFFAYQYVPNIAVRVASSQAGIDASLPTYRPSGFSFKEVAVSPGTVVISYSSNGDSQRQFKVMQKNSNWDSQSLLSNYVSQESTDVQTSNQNGKTVYVYGNDSATWVSQGIWYVVEGGTANLNSDQLLKIASSI